MLTLKTLQPGDEALLEAFLCKHTDTSMFLRSNWREGGLIDDGERFQGTYVAVIEDNHIYAVAAHYWNGMVIVQAPLYLSQVVEAVVQQSSRVVSGIAGPATQVELAKQVLGLSNQPTHIDEQELLFSLILEDLQIPPALASGKVKCRFPHPQELELLTQWRMAYNQETLGKLATPDLLATSRREIEINHATARHWVLTLDNTPVAYTAFNARLPDIVQIGGVWTPPELRAQGYGKCVVAGSLLEARPTVGGTPSQGVQSAVLFTNKQNYPAQAAYQGIGFRPTGEQFGLVLFANESIVHSP